MMMMKMTMPIAVMIVGLTIRGPHTNVRRGPFSHTCTQDFLWGCTFFPKKLMPFLVVKFFSSPPPKKKFF